MVSLRDPGTTGNFEVSVNGALVHSKKKENQGFLDSPAKLQPVFDAIENAEHMEHMKAPEPAGGGCIIL